MLRRNNIFDNILQRINVIFQGKVVVLIRRDRHKDDTVVPFGS